jgi:D-alanine transaminase
VISYLNGEYLPHDRCTVHIDDRGLLFGDGLYEVWRSHHKVFFGDREHLARMRYGAEQIRLALPWSDDEIIGVAHRLQELNGLTDTLIYLQVTRGAATPRTHHFPKDARPTIFMTARAAKTTPWEERQAGVKCITLPDLRWARCDIKTVNLLPNALARQAAVENGAYDAILCRDGFVTEGGATNVYAVAGGKVHTHPKNPRVLGGITRGFILTFAAELGIPVIEEPFPREWLWTADEVFISSVSIDILPVNCIDGRPAGGGKMGPVARALYGRFHETYQGMKL